MDDSGVSGQSVRAAPQPAFAGLSERDRKTKKLFKTTAAIVAVVLLLLTVSGVLYYQSLKATPQYSLALLVDAAGRDDHAEIDSLIDVNLVVDDFVPQVTGKAVELYGRGQPPEVLQKVARLAQPLLPAVKDRARAELPRVIREKTGRYADVPFFAMVLGADRYLDITIDGDTALVLSKLEDHPLEMKMRRIEGRWQIVSVKDEQVATAIAQKIGQEIMAIAVGGGKSAAGQFGIGNLSNLLRQAEELVK